MKRLLLFFTAVMIAGMSLAHAQGDQQNEITVRISKASVQAAGWQGLSIYAWNSSGELCGGWPGVTLSGSSDLYEGYYQWSFFGADTVNIVWNDAIDGVSHAQTLDIVGITGPTCFALGDSLGYGNPNRYYGHTIIDCGSLIPQPVNSITLGFGAPAEWDSVFLYAWRDGGGDLLGGWPGLQLAPNEHGWYYHTIDSLAAVNYIWNSGRGGVQTADLRTEASVCQIINPIASNYPLLVVDAECNSPMPIDTTPQPVDSTIHMVYLWNNLTRAVYDSIAVVHGGDVTLPQPSDTYEGYHFVFWDGLYDGSNVIYNVTENIWMQAKYYINLPEEAPSDPITVRLNPQSIPDSWEQVYVYSWTQGADAGVWPGQLMHQGEDGWYTHTFPQGIHNIDMLFCNGEGNIGNQTVDIDDVNADYCFTLTNPLDTVYGYYMVYPTECAELPPTSNLTVHLVPTNGVGWENVYLYAWIEDENREVKSVPCGGWPGTQVSLDSLGWYSYTFTHDSAVNIIWNDGTIGLGRTHQTVDIMNVTSDKYYRLFFGKDSLNNTLVEEIPASSNPSDFHTVAFIDYDYDMELLMIEQVRHGEFISYWPMNPHHEGIVFIKWIALDPVTTVMIGDVTEETPVVSDMIIDELYDRAQYMCYMLDWDGTLLFYANVYHGNSVLMNDLYPPYREGWEFVGWSDSLQYITSLRFSVALYRPLSVGAYSVIYQGKDGQLIDQQNVDLNLPVPEAIEHFTFVGWKVLEGTLDNGTITIQAIYQPDGTVDAPRVEGEDNTEKVLREGKIYVIGADGKVYSSDGKLVERK